MEHKPKLPPEENARRMKLWQQGYTDSQIAREVSCHPGSIKSWREARGLPQNRTPKMPSKLRNEWGLAPGDRVRVGLKYGNGASSRVKWHTGEVVTLYPRFIVVRLGKYRITVARWELKDGTVKVERLARKAG